MKWFLNYLYNIVFTSVLSKALDCISTISFIQKQIRSNEFKEKEWNWKYYQEKKWSLVHSSDNSSDSEEMDSLEQINIGYYIETNSILRVSSILPILI